jgi:SagB-type dehydrogenase family enzyme
VAGLRIGLIAFLLIDGGSSMTGPGCDSQPSSTWQEGGDVALPAPRTSGPISVEEVIHRRRSVREFRKESLALASLSQLLWAAQGITSEGGLRSAPSAGATYPLRIWVVAGVVESLPSGIYRYVPERHVLVLGAPGDHRSAVARAALDQRWMADAPVILVVCAEFARTTGRYGDRGQRYVHMEVGHVAQNVSLQAGALGLGTTVVGAFRDAEVARVVALASREQPLALLPVGVRR